MQKKSITIKDVARYAGVSTSTVSHVINRTRFVKDSTRQKVLKAISDLGYHPNILARNLRRSKTNTVGLIICDLTNPFFSEILRGIEQCLGKEGYSIIVANTDYDIKKESDSVRLFYSKRVDGFIIVPASNEDRHVKFLVDNNVPIVLLDRKLDKVRADSVIVDNFGGTKKLTAHLINSGHRRIGIITGSTNCTPGKERLAGYLEALKMSNLSMDQTLIKIGNFKQESGYKLTLELLSLPSPPTAIVACNNLMGLGVLDALKDRKIHIPEEIAVGVFDDMPWFRHINPPLTVVAQPSFELGVTAGRLLLEQIKKERRKPREIVFKVDLVVRDSAGEKEEKRSKMYI